MNEIELQQDYDDAMSAENTTLLNLIQGTKDLKADMVRTAETVKALEDYWSKK